MPVEVSLAKFSAGELTVPLISEMAVEPANTVLALTKFTESQINVDCWLEPIVATEPPVFVVNVIVKLDAPPTVAFWT